MSKKAILDSEIESALEEMFGFPSDPVQSEDNATRLQLILEDLDEPGLRSTIRASPQPSTSSDDTNLQSVEPITSSLSPQPCSSFLPNNTNPGINQPTSSTRGRGDELRAGRERMDNGVCNLNNDSSESLEPEADSETTNSDEDEETWKKSMWTDDRPTADTFDSVPMIPTRMLPPNASIRHFEKMFTGEVFELIIAETNRYANQKSVVGWTDIDGPELKAFLGIVIIMGYNILPSMELYWSSDPGFRVDEIASIMTYRRFKQILRCLHLNDFFFHFF